jgi:epoxyqueuosine reductase
MESPKINLKNFAKKIGFDKIGFATAYHLKSEVENYLKWIDSGFHANMIYLDKNFDKRLDVTSILPDAKTVIVLAINYFSKPRYNDDTIPEDYHIISRYAWGDDYHEIIKPRLELISERISVLFPNSTSIPYVDSGPVMEKQWAIRAGIGWQGKNSIILNREFGSWIFLGTIITSAEITPDEQIKDYCGNCTRCIDACPTKAIVKPKVIDANKCISYWTIEAKANLEIPDNVSGQISNCLYGCDICQQVCPWNNKFQKLSEECRFYPRYNETVLSSETVLSYSQDSFSARFKNSPIKRTKLEGLQRNLRAIIKTPNQK